MLFLHVRECHHVLPHQPVVDRSHGSWCATQARTSKRATPKVDAEDNAICHGVNVEFGEWVPPTRLRARHNPVYCTGGQWSAPQKAAAALTPYRDPLLRVQAGDVVVNCSAPPGPSAMSRLTPPASLAVQDPRTPRAPRGTHADHCWSRGALSDHPLIL